MVGWFAYLHISLGSSAGCVAQYLLNVSVLVVGITDHIMLNDFLFLVLAAMFSLQLFHSFHYPNEN